MQADLTNRSVLLAGLGNIGSSVAPLLARAGVGRLVLVDRDVVEARNLTVQEYTPADVGIPKALAQASRLRGQFPRLIVEAHHCDLEDLPVGVGCVDVILGALDSRRARQVLAGDLAWPLGVPLVDGGVGDPLLGRVQVFLPGPANACLECTWGAGDYRLLAGEYPCQGGAAAGPAPTGAPAFLGAFTGALLVAECVRLLGSNQPLESYEIVFDLQQQALRRFVLKRSPRCRYGHQVVRATLSAGRTAADLLAVAERECGAGVGLACRRGLGVAGRNYLTAEGLRGQADKELTAMGFVQGDRVRACGPDGDVFLAVGEE